jgi:predicted permease
MDSLIQDLRYALRGFLRTPGFTAAVVITLAVGIGANTAIFSVIDHIILRPLRYEHPEQLVTMFEVIPRVRQTFPTLPVTPKHFLEWRAGARSFEDLALVEGDIFNLTGSGEPERLDAGRASANLFAMLGVRPQLGRLFRTEEDDPGRDRVVLLDDAFWRRKFGADPGIVGRTLDLNGIPYEVIGILPGDFRFPPLGQLYGMEVSAAARPQLWKPAGLKGGDLAAGNYSFICIGRLKQGVVQAQALAELNAIQWRIDDEHLGLQVSMVPLQDQVTGKTRLALQLLFGAVMMLLAICCVNVSNMLVARGVGRQRDFAIRTAIGATPGRLVQQVVVESLMLALSGGALAILVAQSSLRALTMYAPADLPRIDEVVLDGRVFVFTLGATLTAGILSALLPAWHFAKSAPQESMKAVSRSATASRAAARVRSALVALEVALCLVCLMAGGLLLRSFTGLLRVDRGFQGERIITANFNLPASRYENQEQRVAVARLALERLRSVAGADSVGFINRLPLSGQGSSTSVRVEGTTIGTSAPPLANIRQVSPEYFRTMAIPLKTGRVFEPSDGSRPVAVISALTAQRLWPDSDAVGKRVRIGPDDTPLVEVVGVVGDVRTVNLADVSSLVVYEPYWQQSFNGGSFVIRTAGDSGRVFAGVRAAIRAIDPQLPIPALRTMDDLVAESVAARRFQMMLVLLFSVIAVFLASLGVFGVLSHAVAQRTGEIGVRMALGAAPSSISRLVVRQGLMPVALGIAAGIVGAVPVGRALRGFLFGVTPTDPVTYVGVAALLSFVAIVAILVPARRAAAVDPIVTLRYE